jgi:hypothetical protein
MRQARKRAELSADMVLGELWQVPLRLREWRLPDPGHVVWCVCEVLLQELYPACSPGAPCVLGECGCGCWGWLALPKHMSLLRYVSGVYCGVVEGVAKPLAAAVVCSRQMEGPQPQPVMLFAGHSLSCSAAACVRG